MPIFVDCQHAMAEAELASVPLMLISEQVTRHQKGFELPATHDVTFEFPGLKVVLHMRVSTRSAADAHGPLGQLAGHLPEMIMAVL